MANARQLPAVCDNCRQVWMPNAIGMGVGSSVAIENVSVAPCPYCGGEGHIPDGLYAAATEGIRAFATSPKSVESLALLRSLLEDAAKQEASGAQVADTIEKRAPQYSKLANLLRRFGPADVIALITLLVMLITWYQSNQDSEAQLGAIHAQTEASQTQTEELQRIYDAIVNQGQGPTGSQSAIKLGRNEPCWCGSGKKFKRCHGR